MKRNQSKLHNSLIVLFTILFLVFTLAFFISISDKNIAFAQQNQEISVDGCDFSDNSVLVTMDKDVGGVNKVHNKSYFGDIAIKDITDLTYRENVANVDLDRFKQILKLELQYHDKNYVLQAVEKIGKLKGVETVTPNYIGEFCATANDTDYGRQWGLNGVNGINIEPAWDITVGSKKVRVGVIDTGIAQHPDLNDNLAIGRNFVTGSSITGDTIGHGTHVAGIIGAVGNNNSGISGVCQTVELVPLKISNEDVWSTDKAIQAINYADNLWGTDKQIDLLNFSGWNFPNTPDLYNAISTYRGLFITIAGNGEEDLWGFGRGYNIDDRPNYPGSFDCDNIITVGAINKNGRRCGFSNYGEKSVDIYAPGEDIYSTYINYRYETMDGTSMAAPFVTGVAALLLSYDKTLTAFELKEIILNNADDITISTPDGDQNVKKLNAYKPLKQLVDGYNGETYTVTLHHNTGDRDVVDQVYVKYGDFMPLPRGEDYAPTYTGHEFVGYYFDENGGGAPYYTMAIKAREFYVEADEQFYEGLVPQMRWLQHSDGDLYANWKVLECDYTYENVKLNNGFFDEQSTVHLVHGEQATITAESFEGYKFLYFYRDTKQFTTSTVTWDMELKRSGVDGLIYPKDRFFAVYEKKGSNSQTCVGEGTLITLADGMQVPVEQLTGDEMLLVWNLYTGTFDTAPILFVDSFAPEMYEVVYLYFSDGTQVKVIGEHGFWDFNLNKYVYLDENAAEYIGHWFNKQITDDTGNFAWEKVQLTDVVIEYEFTTAWSPVTYGHLCYYVDGMLSVPGGISGLFNIFEVDESTMSYDFESMQNDIEQYDLFTYEEFAEILPVPEEIFNAFSGQYLKVAIGKGLIDFETLAYLVERYQEFF